METTYESSQEFKAEPIEETMNPDTRPITEPSIAPEETLAYWKNNYLELVAEFQNYQKRMAKSQEKLLELLNIQVVSGMVPVLQDFRRALLEIENSEQAKPIAAGVRLIYDKCYQILQKQGLTTISVAVGDDFDPEQHEALAQVAVEDPNLKGKVTEVVEEGYILASRIVSVAKVIVAV